MLGLSAIIRIFLLAYGLVIKITVNWDLTHIQIVMEHPSTRVNVLFAQLMNGMNAVVPDIVNAESRFQMPAGVVNRSFCGISGLAPSAECSAAGLVRSDLFNAKVFLPNKPDDSLVSSSYVLMNGEKYRALRRDAV